MVTFSHRFRFWNHSKNRPNCGRQMVSQSPNGWRGSIIRNTTRTAGFVWKYGTPNTQYSIFIKRRPWHIRLGIAPFPTKNGLFSVSIYQGQSGSYSDIGGSIHPVPTVQFAAFKWPKLGKDGGSMFANTEMWEIIKSWFIAMKKLMFLFACYIM